MVKEAKEFLRNNAEGGKTLRRLSIVSEIQPRPSTVAKEVLISMGGMCEEQVCQSVEMYDPDKDKWQPLADLPSKVSHFSAAVLSNMIYVCGGLVESTSVPTVWGFEPNSRCWSSKPDMLQARAKHTSTSWNDCLFVLGGIDTTNNKAIIYINKNAIYSIESYSLTQQQWTCVGYNPFPRVMSNISTSGQNLLLEVGGTQCGGVVQSTVECYQRTVDTVNYSGEHFVLPNPLRYGKIFVIGQLFYILWEDSKKLISLDPDRRLFRSLADMHHPHIHSGVSLISGKIYVIGGENEYERNSVCECYDIESNTWTIVHQLCDRKSLLSCVSLQMCS